MFICVLNRAVGALHWIPEDEEGCKHWNPVLLFRRFSYVFR